MFNEKFEKYTPNAARSQPLPKKMKVGQICIRKRSDGYEKQLKTMMRKAMDQGMEFSIAQNDSEFAIRRDK